MKNRKITLRNTILVALMFTAMIGNATHGLHNDPKNKIKKTTFSLNYVKTGNQLKIKDLNGIILYKEDIKTSGTYSKGFDLTSLPNGSYVFELEKDLEIKSFPFTVTSQNVVFDKEETIIHKPFVTVKDNYIYVSKLALNEESLDIKIYYQEASELIYSEKVENTKNIQKLFKLKSTEKGDYKIVLTSNGREYYESITL